VFSEADYHRLRGLVAYYAERLITYTRPKGIEIDDLMQEFWLYLIRMNKSEKKFIYRRLISILKDKTEWRQKKRHNCFETSYELLMQDEDGNHFGAGFYCNQEIERVDFEDLINHLKINEASRYALMMYFMGGYRQREIGSRLGISFTRVSKLIRDTYPYIKKYVLTHRLLKE